MNFQQHLKEILKTKKISLVELAERAGMPYRTVQNISADGNPTLSNLEKIANSLNMPISELLNYHEPAKELNIELQNRIDLLIQRNREIAEKLEAIKNKLK